jgi:hypothetical protein
MTRDLIIASALVSLVALAFYGVLGGHAAPPPTSREAGDWSTSASLRTASRPPFGVEEGVEPWGHRGT